MTPAEEQQREERYDNRFRHGDSRDEAFRPRRHPRKFIKGERELRAASSNRAASRRRSLLRSIASSGIGLPPRCTLMQRIASELTTTRLALP